MESENLNILGFEKELRQMAESCIGVKPNTAKKKASKIFKKYQDLISNSLSTVEYERKYAKELRLKYEALKFGIIDYKRKNVSGRLLLKDIEQVEVNEEGVLIITKTGREIKLSSDFKYLKDIL
jgi:hypothetical protein